MKDLLMKESQKISNTTLTDNGSKTFKSSLNKNVDLFSVGGSSRNMPEYEVESLISKALSEDLELGLMNILYLSHQYQKQYIFS